MASNASNISAPHNVSQNQTSSQNNYAQKRDSSDFEEKLYAEEKKLKQKVSVGSLLISPYKDFLEILLGSSNSNNNISSVEIDKYLEDSNQKPIIIQDKQKNSSEEKNPETSKENTIPIANTEQKITHEIIKRTYQILFGDLIFL